MSCVRLYGYLQCKSLYIYCKEKFREKVIQNMETLHSMHLYIRPSVLEMIEQSRRYGNITKFPYAPWSPDHIPIPVVSRSRALLITCSPDHELS
jgi:hypothetical protein